jgi:uncharacterized protein YaiI (UPF0178 family)
LSQGNQGNPVSGGGTAADFADDTIRERLAMRDFMDVLRSSGVETGGPAALSQGDRQAFANQLDRLLAKVSGR